MTPRLASAAFLLALALVASIGLVAAQGGKVAMLLPGSINDQSWNASGYAGLLKLKDAGD